MIQAKQQLLEALGAAVAQLAPGTAFEPAFESPKQAAHGDFAVTAAMQLARGLKRNPRELATLMVDALRAQPAVERWVEALDIAGPCFINLKLKAAGKAAKGAGKAAKGTAVYKVAKKTPVVKRIPVLIGAGVAAIVATKVVKSRHGDAQAAT